MESNKRQSIILAIVTTIIVLGMILVRVNEVKKENTPEAIKSQRM